MPQVLSYQNDSDRGNEGHCAWMEAWSSEVWQANPCSIIQVSEVNRFAQTKPIGKQQVDEVANDATKQNGEPAQRSRSIGSNQCNSEQRDESHPRIKLTATDISDSYRSKIKANSGNNSASDGRWHQVFDPPVAGEYDNKTDDGIDDTCRDDTS